MGHSSSKSLGIPPGIGIGSTLMAQPPASAPAITGIFPIPLSPMTVTAMPVGQVEYDCPQLTSAVQRLHITPVPRQVQINGGTDAATVGGKDAVANGTLSPFYADQITARKFAKRKPADTDTMGVQQTRRKAKSQPLFKYDHYGKLIGGNHLGDEFRQETSVVAIDCEMVGVDGGDRESVLARVSIVNQHGFCLYDTFVKPKLPVVEYRTEKSGVREADLVNAPPHDLVIQEVATMLNGKIVVGHSVHNDFDVIQLAHPPRNTRDTATYYRALREMKQFPGLKVLCQDVLNWKIQQGEHSSIVDAQATMELYMREEVNWEASLKPIWNGATRALQTPTGVTNWKMMTVYPRNPELFLDKEFVRPIQMDRPYMSDDEYLDTQFRLLREDFMKPLREGIQQFKRWRHTKQKKVAPSQVRVYENVRILGGGKFQETKGMQRITIPVVQKNGDLSSTSEDSRILINGSLLLFSQNLNSSGGSDFTCVKLAIVNRISAEDDDRLKQHGILNVNFIPDGPTWRINPGVTFTVLESVAFFEAYRFALENLQVLNMVNWPLAKYIRDPTIPFKSISAGSHCFDFSKQVEDVIVAPPRFFQAQFPGFPTAAQLGLSKTQYEAYHAALTKEVAIIQGPPGTGKTFIAMKVIKFFLCNPRLLNGQPIVIVSNTNHSLDHLLEMVILYAREMTGSCTAGDDLVLRLGGRSKSDLVSSVSLWAKREGYAMKTYTDHQLAKTRQKLIAIHAVCSSTFASAKDFAVARYKLLSALTCIKADSPLALSKYTTEEEEEEMRLEKQIHALMTEIVEGIDAQAVIVGKTKKLKADWNKLIGLLPSLVEFVRKTEKVLEQDFARVQHCKPENQILRAARVLGMTVTGSAKHKTKILEKLKPIMVVVEEAAHVLESTVVAGLTKSCKRLILIGDHKQLRPSTADYELTKANHLDVSMMERFVRNAEGRGLKTWTQLDTQRRMRPEIARLITPTIYTELYDDPVVMNYPDVKGMEKNLFFLDHGEFEEKAEDSTSFVNLKEADFLINLCLYLIGQGNEPSKITIITTYLGQKIELEKRMKQTQYFQKVRICCVDGFQGEENDIILLSLVRSNDKRSIGFLTTNNRVCVALSRARHGMYIVGNMSGLAARSRTWADIQQTLISGNSIGKTLRLKCDFHGGLTPVDIQTLQVQNGKTKKCFCPTFASGVWERRIESSHQAQPGGVHKGNGSKIQNGAAGGHKMKTNQGRSEAKLGSPGSKSTASSSPEAICGVAKEEASGKTQGKNEKKTRGSGCGQKFSCGHFCEQPGCNKNGHTAYNCQQKCHRTCNGGHKCPGTHACYLPCPILTSCCRQVSTTCSACGNNKVGLCCVLLPYHGKKSPSYGQAKKTLCSACQPKKGDKKRK